MSETLLAFDVGARRIGVAVGNDLVRRAHAAAIVGLQPGDDPIEAVARLVDEWRPERMVVGMPCPVGELPEDKTRRASQARCEDFAQCLAQRFGIPVERVDERYSSIDADRVQRERRAAGLVRRAKVLDDVAAEVILQRYFDSLPS